MAGGAEINNELTEPVAQNATATVIVGIVSPGVASDLGVEEPVLYTDENMPKRGEREWLYSTRLPPLENPNPEVCEGNASCLVDLRELEEKEYKVYVGGEPDPNNPNNMEYRNLQAYPRYFTVVSDNPKAQVTCEKGCSFQTGKYYTNLCCGWEEDWRTEDLFPSASGDPVYMRNFVVSAGKHSPFEKPFFLVRTT